MFRPRFSTKMHHMPGLTAASLQSLCKTKWLLKLGWGWRYVRSNTKIAKSLFCYSKRPLPVILHFPNNIRNINVKLLCYLICYLQMATKSLHQNRRTPAKAPSKTEEILSWTRYWDFRSSVLSQESLWCLFGVYIFKHRNKSSKDFILVMKKKNILKIVKVSWKTQLAETTWFFLYICSQID